MDIETTMPQPHEPPLNGIKVLDLTRVLAGPWCTMTLADLGAEVIKVEQPGIGDDTRHWGPPYIGSESAYYLCTNRGKKSVAVDMADPDGQEIIRELARDSDVLVENFKFGSLEKYGLDYLSITTINPRLIYCSISGYGRDSPAAERPGYDYVMQAEGGLMAVTGEVDGEPMKVGVAVVDLFTGMAATQAILAAIIAQKRDGLGQHIDLALYDCQLAMLANVGSAYLVSGKEPRRYGNGHPTTVPYQIFETLAGRIVVAVGNDRQFAFLCRDVLGLHDLAQDGRFMKNSSRNENRDALIPLLAKAFLDHPPEYWLPKLAEFGVPCGKVRSVGQALRSPEADARKMVVSVDHATLGTVELVASPLRLSRTPVRLTAAPPLLGEHTDQVVAQIAARRAARSNG